MGQNNPYLPNGQPVGIPQQNLLAQLGAASMHCAVPQQGQSMQGFDPSMMAAAQHSLNNPNAEDAFNILPGPTEMAIGAAGGIGLAYGLNRLMRNPDQEKQIGPILKLAKTIDNTRFVQWINGKLNQNILEKTANAQEKAWLKEMLLTHATHGEGAEKAIQEMEKHHLGMSMANFQKYFAKRPAVKTAYTNMLKDKALQDKLHEAGLSHSLNLVEASKIPDIQKAGFNTTLQSIETKIGYLKQLPQKSKEQKRLLRSLQNLQERVHGLSGHYGTMYRSQVNLASELTEKSVGPVGRLFTSGFHYLQRIFNGETMRMSQKSVAAGEQNFWSKLFSKISNVAFPGIAGALIMGQSLDKAHKAQDGEKTKTFFHDFLGTGLFNFIGWEVGRKVLNSIGFADKVLGKSVANRLPGILAKIPFLGGITLGGFVTEIVALGIVAYPFQKFGEMLAHMVWGKPSQASLDGKSKKQPSELLTNSLQAPSGILPGSTMNTQGYLPQTAMSQPIQPNYFANPNPPWRQYAQTQALSQATGSLFSLTPQPVRSNAITAQTQNLPSRFQTNNQWQ